MHGGTKKAGIASPSFKNGRYSTAIPARLVPAYDQSRADASRLDLDDEIDLIHARIEDLCKTVDQGSSGETWTALFDAAREFEQFERKAMSTSNEGKRAEWLAERDERMRMIVTLTQAGMSDYAAWREVLNLVERRRKLVETQSKRQIALQTLMTEEQSNWLLARLQSILLTHVTDRTALNAIALELEGLYKTSPQIRQLPSAAPPDADPFAP